MPQTKSDRSVTRATSAALEQQQQQQHSSSSRSTHGPSPYARPHRKQSSSGDEIETPKPPPPPRSNRQQYSACGACRMRRVKCDLKEMAVVVPHGVRPVCSNCKERSINCVFTVVAGGDHDPLPAGDYQPSMADGSKPGGKQKLLRRGRRIQGAEAIFGKVTDGAYSEPPSTIPDLSGEFFASPFFRRLHVQRPIIDPTEFGARYAAYAAGDRTALDGAGQLVAKLLVVWAHAYGHNETGAPQDPQDAYLDGLELSQRRIEWAQRVREMLDEILRGIDTHGVLRRPSWDGVRALLLLLPLLTESGQSSQPLERLALIEGALAHAWALCSHAPAPAGGDHLRDALVRARVFWYAYVYEGTTAGPRGARLVLGPDDVELFQQTLPRIPPSPPPVLPPSAAAFEAARRQADVLIDIANACRQVHAALTGPRARSRSQIDERMLSSAWSALDFGWQSLEHMRVTGAADMTEDELDMFISSWQMFLFESHNIIREVLKRRVVTHDPSTASGVPGSPGVHEQAVRLHQQALYKCHQALHSVLPLIRQHLGTPFFAYDAALVRDASFFAAILLTTTDAGAATAEDELRADIDACLTAMRQMRFAFSRADDRERSVDQAWQRRQQRLEAEAAAAGPFAFGHAAAAVAAQQASAAPQLAYSAVYPPLVGYASTPPGSAHSRPSTAGAPPHTAQGLVGYPTQTTSPLEHSFAYEYHGSTAATPHDRVSLGGLPPLAGSSILPTPTSYLAHSYSAASATAPYNDWTSQTTHIQLPQPTDTSRRH